jgi:phosphoribosyl 1,2-cyclic phosphodiesterase
MRLKRALRDFFASGRTSPEQIDSFIDARSVADSGGYGGNTLCVEVSVGDQSLIIDAGSGLRRLGEVLMSGPCGKGKGEVDLLFTHFHWDHLIGLPFFVPIFVPGNKIRIHAVQPELEACIRAKFTKPFFPVPFDELRSTVTFHRLEPRKAAQISGMKVTPYQLDHPDPCWGFRIEHQGKVYAHCVDTEGTRTTREQLGADLPLYQNADLVLFDAQYTLMEAAEKMNWGHSAGPIGIDIAIREHVKRIVFVHHDPGASDEKITDAARQTHEYLQALRTMTARPEERSKLEWSFAREGDCFELK